MRREKTQSNKTRKEKGEITINTNKIQGIKNSLKTYI
jgi:hypothetical protein